MGGPGPSSLALTLAPYWLPTLFPAAQCQLFLQLNNFIWAFRKLRFVRLLTRLGGALVSLQVARNGSANEQEDSEIQEPEESHALVRIIRNPPGIDDFMLSMLH